MPGDDFRLRRRGGGRNLGRGGSDSGYTGVPGPDFGLDDGLMSVEDGSMASQLHLTRAHPEHVRYPDQVVIDGPVESIMPDEMNEVGTPAYEKPAPIIHQPHPAHHHQPPQTGITMEEAFNRHIQSQDQGASITHHPSTPRSTTQPTYLGQATPPGLNNHTLHDLGLIQFQQANGEGLGPEEQREDEPPAALYAAWKSVLHTRLQRGANVDNWRRDVRGRRLAPEGEEPCKEIEHVSVYDEVAVQSEAGVQYFDKDAKMKTAKGNEPTAIGVKSIKDMIDKLEDLLKPDEDGKCKRIRQLSIHAHGVNISGVRGGFAIGEDDRNNVSSKDEANHLGIILQDALADDAAIKVKSCWGARNDFLANLGRTANAKVLGTTGIINMRYDRDENDPDAEPIKWEAPEGVDEYKPPEDFPDDKERQEEDFLNQDWGETKKAEGVGHRPEGKPERYREGDSQWEH